MKSSCILSELRCFHSVTNYNLDIMHDLLEGVCPYEVKLVLYQLMYVDKLVSLKELNQRIRGFQYSFTDRKNKPSLLVPERMRNVADHKVGQKAAQMWCLLRMMPLLIGDLIPYDNPSYKLLLLLLQCMDIIYAPIIHISQAIYLKHLIDVHHTHFRVTFPNARMINKHHHMVHYCTCIRMSGPLISMQCLKYELKHGFSKRIATVNCNFKNICKSVACKHQILQCAEWSDKLGLRLDFECRGGDIVQISSLDGSGEIAEVLECEEEGDIFLATQVTLFGTIYKPNLFLAISMSGDHEPQFGKISGILVCGSTPESVFFVVKMYRTEDFNTHFHAYQVSELEPFSVVQFTALLDHLPLSELNSYEDDSPIYLCPRYVLQQLPRYIPIYLFQKQVYFYMCKSISKGCSCRPAHATPFMNNDHPVRLYFHYILLSIEIYYICKYGLYLIITS